jgi:four helix bundle protein
MLRIYKVVLEALRELQPVLRQMEERDSDLARQLRRCSSSVALNLAEGMYSKAGHRALRYRTALGSAREALACLEVASACFYIEPVPSLEDKFSRIVGTIAKLV